MDASTFVLFLELAVGITVFLSVLIIFVIWFRAAQTGRPSPIEVPQWFIPFAKNRLTSVLIAAILGVFSMLILETHTTTTIIAPWWPEMIIVAIAFILIDVAQGSSVSTIGAHASLLFIFGVVLTICISLNVSCEQFGGTWRTPPYHIRGHPEEVCQGFRYDQWWNAQPRI